MRLNRLISTFGAFWCAQADEHGRPIEGSQSKLYLLDPVITQLPALRDDPTYTRPGMTNLTESHLALELGRAINELHPERFVEQRAVMYARSGSGNEVDFAPPVHRGGTETRTAPLEARWVTHNWRSEALVMRGRYGAGVLGTKDIVDLDGAIWAIPAPMVALLLQ
jgi:uncharacterized protein